jgi:hypothetical protein
MTDYISREAAIKAMDSLLHQNFLCVPDSVAQAAATAGYMDGVKDADIRLRSVPAADVRPVVRGKWIMTTERFAPERICSSCKCRFPVSAGEGITEVLNFCPNCGADMREANDEKA